MLFSSKDDPARTPARDRSPARRGSSCPRSRARRYIEQIVESRPSEESVGREKTRSIGEAIDRILELREGTDLCGLNIKGLIDEGRKY